MEQKSRVHVTGTSLVQSGPLWTAAPEQREKVAEEPVAILVCHGMGQQVRFETISSIAQAIRTEVEEDGGVCDPIQVHVTQANDDFLARAELSWRDKDSQSHEAHVYEAYWAPLTEGQISYWDTVKFLVSAAWNGLRYSQLFHSSRFYRWMFDGPKPMRIGPVTFFAILVMLFVMAVQLGIIAFASVEVARWIKNLSTVQLPAVHGAGAWIKFLVTLLPAGIGVLFDWARAFDRDWFRALAWIVAVVEAYVAHYFIVEYVGSVAAYISPYKDSKFYKIRDQIQQIAFNVGKVIYGFPGDTEWKYPKGAHPIPFSTPRYGKVLMVGHSLGSVLAYDTLNRLINLDNVCGGSYHVVRRTRALITFGSPLDKTAFLFRMQAKNQQAWIREQLSASVQPLIVSYDLYRPLGFRWVNIWSRADIISGELNYYDDPDVATNDPRHVDNMVDPEANIPLAAHVQYWTNEMLRKQLYSFVVS